MTDVPRIVACAAAVLAAAGAATVADAQRGVPDLTETWARRAYPNLIYFREVDRGGHFAAWEQPELFASELRAAFRPLR